MLCVLFYSMGCILIGKQHHNMKGLLLLILTTDFLQTLGRDGVGPAISDMDKNLTITR